VLLLLVATDGAPELSEVKYTCDYCCCSLPLLLPFFPTVVLLLLVFTPKPFESFRLKNTCGYYW
jgi:hypothetical protein